MDRSSFRGALLLNIDSDIWNSLLAIRVRNLRFDLRGKI